MPVRETSTLPRRALHHEDLLPSDKKGFIAVLFIGKHFVRKHFVCEHSAWEHSAWEHSVCEHSVCEHSARKNFVESAIAREPFIQPKVLKRGSEASIE